MNSRSPRSSRGDEAQLSKDAAPMNDRNSKSQVQPRRHANRHEFQRLPFQPRREKFLGAFVSIRGLEKRVPGSILELGMNHDPSLLTSPATII